MSIQDATLIDKFVDRDEELTTLKGCIQRRTNVLVIGVPGIGKTRLCNELEANLKEECDFFSLDLKTGINLKYFENLRDDWQANPPKRRAVLLLDDFHLQPYLEEALLLFEDLHKNFDVVIVAVARLGEFGRLYHDNVKSSIDAGFPKFLWLLPMKKESLRQILENFVKTKQISNWKLEWYEVNLWAGNPRLAKLIALAAPVAPPDGNRQELLDLLSKKQGQEFWENNLKYLDKSDQLVEETVLEDIWDDFDEGIQNVLKQLAAKRNAARKRSLIPEDDKWWFEKTGWLEKPDLDAFPSEIFKSFVHSRPTDWMAELTRNVLFLFVVSLMALCFTGTILGVLLAAPANWSLVISLVLTGGVIYVLIRNQWWTGPGRLPNLKKLWNVLTVLYTILAGVLAFSLSWWLAPISIGALFAMAMSIRLRIVEMEMEG
jgi:hypothetical protein